MYSPDMVPVGCSHLPCISSIDVAVGLVPNAYFILDGGIQKIAKQLGIQSAPALVGWEYRRGQGYPLIRGIVVAREHAELLNQVFTSFLYFGLHALTTS